MALAIALALRSSITQSLANTRKQWPTYLTSGSCTSRHSTIALLATLTLFTFALFGVTADFHPDSLWMRATVDAIPRVLFERAEAVGDRAHDFYEAGRAPIQWNDVADADTIAALQIPAGFGFGVGDAFPSSESVARSVVAALAARSAG